MKLKVCTGKMCSSKFSKYIISRAENDREFYKYGDLEISESSCMGSCKKAPNVQLGKQKYNYMTPIKTSQIILKENK